MQALYLNTVRPGAFVTDPSNWTREYTEFREIVSELHFGKLRDMERLAREVTDESDFTADIGRYFEPWMRIYGVICTLLLGCNSVGRLRIWNHVEYNHTNVQLVWHHESEPALEFTYRRKADKRRIAETLLHGFVFREFFATH